MRTIRVDEPETGHTWLWLTAGAALGLVAGVMLADRIKGPKGSLRSLATRGRRLATNAIKSWGPLLDTARSIKEAWDESGEDEDETWADEEQIDEGTTAEADDDLDNDAEEAEFEEEEEDDGALDARVLVAFVNDPILVESALEIEERRPGVIVLHGRVQSAREGKHAVTIARGVPGVERVRTRLTVG